MALPEVFFFFLFYLLKKVFFTFPFKFFLTPVEAQRMSFTVQTVKPIEAM